MSTSKKRFEAWAKQGTPPPPVFKNGEYIDRHLQFAYEAAQAAERAAVKRCMELVSQFDKGWVCAELVDAIRAEFSEHFEEPRT